MKYIIETATRATAATTLCPALTSSSAPPFGTPPATKLTNTLPFQLTCCTHNFAFSIHQFKSSFTNAIRDSTNHIFIDRRAIINAACRIVSIANTAAVILSNASRIRRYILLYRIFWIGSRAIPSICTETRAGGPDDDAFAA